MIGVIVRTNDNTDDFHDDWEPEEIDVFSMKRALTDTIGFAPETERFEYLENNCCIHFTVDDLEHPKSITFNCTEVEEHKEIINKIISIMGAKIFDSDSGDFFKQI